MKTEMAKNHGKGNEIWDVGVEISLDSPTGYIGVE